MRNAPLELCYTRRIHAANRNFLLRTLNGGVARRTLLWEFKTLFLPVPSLFQHGGNLWNHIASAFQHHRVADANVFSDNLLLVMQGSVCNRGPGKCDRGQNRNGG